MDPSLTLPPLNVPALLRAHALTPKKGLGQNFLIDPAALQRVVQAAEITPQDAVLEVGPGLGSLTRHLAHAARHVVAVELDTRLLPILQEVLQKFSNIQLVQGDMLKIDPASLMPEDGYLVVANIPYYITSALIRHLIEARVRPNRLVLTVQKEVAERVCAAPGQMNLLALGVQVYGKPRLAASIPAGAFYPVPAVDSSVLRIDLYPQPFLPFEQLPLFFQLAHAGFAQKRKTLRNCLSAGLKCSGAEAETLLRSANIDPQRRAETLSLEEWRALVQQRLASLG
jgi:16S rRNA (adenine1518-N6/adenine1519-N6)-dimethyltransferase